jgi:hypothetical protein
LWFSHHPGTSSMGKLMALSLLATLSAAVIFQPALIATQQQLRLDLSKGAIFRKTGIAAKKLQSSLPTFAVLSIGTRVRSLVRRLVTLI